MSNFVRVPYVSISPSRITTFWRCEPRRVKQSEQLSVFEEENQSIINVNTPPRFKQHTGIISKKAKKRIDKAIDWLLVLAKNKRVINAKKRKSFMFKVSFVTLTLSSTQIHSDREIKEKLLNHFLVEARKRWQIDKYIWRAEKQMNGNIHFHIVVDKFISHTELRNVWNRIQNKLGYVDRYQKKQKEFFKDGFRFQPKYNNSWSYASQRKAYYIGKSSDFTNPNSTDVHKLHKIKNLSAYISKYCSKNPEKQIAKKHQTPVNTQEFFFTEFDPYSAKPVLKYKSKLVDGKSWGLSQSLSKMKNIVVPRDSFIDEELRVLEDTFYNQMFVTDYFVTLKIHFNQWKEILGNTLKTIFETYLEEVRKQLREENLKIIFNNW